MLAVPHVALPTAARMFSLYSTDCAGGAVTAITRNTTAAFRAKAPAYCFKLLTCDIQPLLGKVVNALHNLLMTYIFADQVLGSQIIRSHKLVKGRHQDHLVDIVHVQELSRASCGTMPCIS